MRADKVLTPTVYAFSTNGVRHTNLNEDKPFEWCGSTVADILEREEYIGNTINCRSYSPSLKNKKSKLNPPEKQLRFEHTHEPIIDLETWEIVRKVRAGKRRSNKMGEMDMLSGMVYCADCGKRHYFCRCGSWNEAQYTYTCGTYHGHKEECTPHTVKVMALHEIVLAEVQRVTQEAREHTEEFLQRAMDKHSSQLRKELSVKTRELEKVQKRLADLEKLFRTAFEQLALANLSETQFKALTDGYEDEKQKLLTRIETLEQEI